MRLPALDGLRGVAVLAVLGSHLFFGTPHGPASRAAMRLLSFGASGVDLFFALSGFLITGILVDTVADRHYFRTFYGRRALRILPLYYAVLLGFAIGGWAMHAGFGRQLLSLALFVQNTHWVTEPIWRYRGVPPLPLVHFWSLAVEEQFYLLWPVCVWLLRRPERVFRACVAGAGVSLVARFVLRQHGVAYQDLHEMTLCRLDVLLAGGALAMQVRAGKTREASKGVWALFVLALIATMLASRTGGSDALHFTLLSLVFALGAAGVLSLGLGKGTSLAPRVLCGRFLRLLGRYSYGIYVWQYIATGLLRTPLETWLRTHGAGKPVAAVALSGCLLGAISVALGWLSFELYEKRFLALKRLLPYRARATDV